MTEQTKIDRLNRKFNIFGGWCGLFYFIGAVVGWWLLGGYWPLHAPTDSEAQIVTFYQDDLISKRLGLVVLMWTAVSMLFFTSAVTNHLSRIEGRSGPLTHCMLLGGYATAMLTFYPCLWWLTALFRPERAPELIYLLSDIGWLQFIGGVSLVATMYVAVAIAAFVDESDKPVFPRWSGYFTCWVLVLLIPGQLLFQFKDGPFAWDGLLAFWVPGILFFAWFIIIGQMIVKADK